MGYKPIIYSRSGLVLPDFNWRVSISEDTFNFNDTTPYKVFWQHEPDEIVPTTETLLKKCGFYDLILTWNHQVLSECPGSKYFPCTGVWWQDANTAQKQFAVSMLISDKLSCFGHRYRHEIFAKLNQWESKRAAGHPLVRTVKHCSPPWLPNKSSMLVPFQFSIAMENACRPNYFTEKIVDCFATKTIPIYWGAPNIGEFFNMDGILPFLGYDGYDGWFHGVQPHLLSLTPEFYESKREAIEDNYQRALKYTDRTGDLIRAINKSWDVRPDHIHSGDPNVR
jgi:Glycosyltransferase family 10 (fucosyltransferase) C-term